MGLGKDEGGDGAREWSWSGLAPWAFSQSSLQHANGGRSRVKLSSAIHSPLPTLHPPLSTLHSPLSILRPQTADRQSPSQPHWPARRSKSSPLIQSTKSGPRSNPIQCNPMQCNPGDARLFRAHQSRRHRGAQFMEMPNAWIAPNCTEQHRTAPHGHCRAQHMPKHRLTPRLPRLRRMSASPTQQA
jgi:hypothetical protein